MIKNKALVIAAAFISVLHVVSFMPSNVQAQTLSAENVCTNRGSDPAGSSGWSTCVQNIQEGYDECNQTTSQGTPARQECREAVVSEYFDVTIGGGNNQNSGETVIEGDCDASELTSDNCQIIRYLVNGINLLSALAGMAIIGSIMIAGYQYMTAQDNSGQIQAAKKRIIWALVALGIFLFMYTFLNFVVPGGVLP